MLETTLISSLNEINPFITPCLLQSLSGISSSNLPFLSIPWIWAPDSVSFSTLPFSCHPSVRRRCQKITPRLKQKRRLVLSQIQSVGLRRYRPVKGPRGGQTCSEMRPPCLFTCRREITCQVWVENGAVRYHSNHLGSCRSKPSCSFSQPWAAVSSSFCLICETGTVARENIQTCSGIVNTTRQGRAPSRTRLQLPPP